MDFKIDSLELWYTTSPPIPMEIETVKSPPKAIKE